MIRGSAARSGREEEEKEAALTTGFWTQAILHDAVSLELTQRMRLGDSRRDLARILQNLAVDGGHAGAALRNTVPSGRYRHASGVRRPSCNP